MTAAVGFAAVAVIGNTTPSNPTNASTRMENGRAVFQNDNYKIDMGDDNTVHIHNKKTGEDYLVHGDPHVNVDGQHAFDFWGTTSFNLDDGTKLTINTTDAGNGMTLASKVTITNGDYGVQVSGVDTKTRGDLQFNETTANGWLMDAQVDDGNQLYENPTGKGFVAVDDNGHVREVNQQYINETDLQKGGALKDKYADAFKQLSSLLSISFFGGFMQGFMQGLQQSQNTPQDKPVHRPRPDMHIMQPQAQNNDFAAFALIMTRDLGQIADLRAVFNR
ncbi:DUF1521 domain-containing protein [Chitinivorax sp. PXF-14]|uniref:DUF1521 domain-containing protein n=1 Tax=Chitinivorax sp. PXF-14 TaxID=3230488 RepID=UPI003466B225